MVEFTDEEEARYQELVKRRAEIQARKDADAKAKQAQESKAIVKAQNAKKGVLEKVADKAESVRGKYDRQKEQAVRIKNAIIPAKQKSARPYQQRQPRQQLPRRAARRGGNARRVYVQPPRQPMNDMLQGFIMGSPSGQSGAGHLNDMIGIGGGSKSGVDFMDTMMHGTGSKKKNGNKDFWREMLGK